MTLTLPGVARRLPGAAGTAKARKYVRLGFHHYPNEALAYAAVLGLIGREDAALQELDAASIRLKASDAERERFRQDLAELWRKGI